jgi:four helix bundle protein
MAPSELRARTKAFAIDVVHLCRSLPRTDEGQIVRWQLLRAGTSVGANYRAACHPRSDADFVSKLGTVIEECDETAFWVELAVEIELASPVTVVKLLKEADELTRIFVASRETIRQRVRARTRVKRS